MKSFFIACLLLLLLPSVSQAQIVKLKSSEGFVQTSDYVKLHYQLLGEGKDTLVVVHGGTTFGAAYLVPDLTPLAAHHTLLFYDQAGAGYSTAVKDTARYHIRRVVADIEAIRQHFKLKQLNLLGHSTGGLICGYYAIAHPERVKSMILVAPVPAAAYQMKDFRPDSRHDSTSLLVLKQNQKKYSSQPVDSTQACWDYYSLWMRGYAATYAEGRNVWGNICNCEQANLLSPHSYYLFKSLGNWNLAPQLTQVQARVLLIGGDKDAIPYPAFELWNKSFPNSTLLPFKGAGHVPYVDQPAAFGLAVGQFLQNKVPEATVLQAKGAGEVWATDAKGSPYLQARAAVIALENELVRRVNNARWDSVAAIYTPDGSIYPPGSPPVMGQKAIATFWLTAARRGLNSLDLQLIDIELSGDLLVAHGKYIMRNSHLEILDIGKFMAIYRKENKQWRLQTDMFNSSLETRSPLEVPDYLALPGE